jgi:hypothetical protein
MDRREGTRNTGTESFTYFLLRLTSNSGADHSTVAYRNGAPSTDGWITVLGGVQGFPRASVRSLRVGVMTAPFMPAIRFHLRIKRIHLEPVVGPVLTWTRTWSQTEPPFRLPSGEISTEPGWIEIDHGVRLGAMAGLDARIGSKYVVLVPSARLARMSDSNSGIVTFPWESEPTALTGSWYPDGLPRWSWRVALVARAEF